MTDIGDTWSGEDWQNYCRQLLNLRYGLNFQSVPDRDQGDFGIDGFTSGGDVFQFYAAQDPRSLDDLYKKQRNKMTADLSTLESNLENVRELTAPASIRCWVLLVPRCETKRIIQHGSTKAAELRNKRLDGIDDDFYVRVLTDEDFAPEKQRLSGVGVALLPDRTPSITDEGVQLWKADSPVAATTLTNKVARLPGIPIQQQQELCGELIRCHLHGSYLREQIRSYQPQMWEHINEAREQRERVLKVEGLAAVPQERLTLRDEVEKLTSRLQSEPMCLELGLAENLTWGFVADWLIWCTLDPLPKTAA